MVDFRLGADVDTMLKSRICRLGSGGRIESSSM
jgi:hypothetical protein